MIIGTLPFNCVNTLFDKFLIFFAAMLMVHWNSGMPRQSTCSSFTNSKQPKCLTNLKRLQKTKMKTHLPYSLYLCAQKAELCVYLVQPMSSYSSSQNKKCQQTLLWVYITVSLILCFLSIYIQELVACIFFMSAHLHTLCRCEQSSIKTFL